MKKSHQVEIRGNTKNYRAEFGRAIKSNDRFNKSMEGLTKGATAIQGPMGGVASRLSVVNSLFRSGALHVAGFAAGIAGLTAVGYKSIKVFDEYQRGQLRTEALLRATGQAAGLTSEQLQEQAEQVALSTLASVGGIVEAQNVLMTFKSVSGDTFRQAISLSQDMAAVFGGTAKDKALQLGKALEDPIQGINALRRSGVSFTQQQKDQIRTMTEAGNVAGAQEIILSQLAAQVGGAGAAEAGGLAGAVDTLGQRWDELLLSFSNTSGSGSVVTTWLNNIANGLDTLRSKISPTTTDLEAELARLQAARASAAANQNTRRGSRGPSPESFDAEIAAIQEQILVARAQSDDLNAITALIANRRNRIAELDGEIANASTRRQRGGRGSEREQLQAQQRALEEEIAQYQAHYDTLNQQAETQKETQKAIQKEQKEAAEALAAERAEREAAQQTRIDAANAREVAAMRDKYAQIHADALTADEQVIQLEEFQYKRRRDALNAELAELREKGLVTEEIEAQHKAALEELEQAHQQRLSELNAQEVAAMRDKYAQIHMDALSADEQAIALETYQYERRLAAINDEVAALREKGVLTAELEAEHKTALEELEQAHQARIGEIKADAREEELQAEAEKNAQLSQGYKALLGVIGSYYDGMQGKQAGYVRMALSLGSMLLDEKKRESVESIWASTYEAAMGAYESLASVPFVGPALGAAAYGGIMLVGGAAAAKVMGMAHKGMTNIPGEGSYILDGGERVVAEEQNRDLTNFLNAQQQPGGQGGQKVEVHNYSGAPVRQLTERDVVKIMVGQAANQSSDFRNVMHTTSTMQPRGRR